MTVKSINNLYYSLLIQNYNKEDEKSSKMIKYAHININYYKIQFFFL